MAVVRCLLAHGAAAAINGVDNSSQTALHKACANGHEAVAKLLIENGCAVNAKCHVRAADSSLYARADLST